MPLIYIAVFWSLYFMLHSVLAADKVKSLVFAKGLLNEKSYRLFYVIISSIGLVALLYVLAVHNHQYIYRSNIIVHFIGLVLATYGVFVLRETFRHYHTKAFLGLAEPALESEKLVTEGLQKHIRHPLYAGIILLLMGFFVYMPSWANLISVVINIVYILIGIHLEENKLIATFGDEYREYRKNVPMLTPGIRKFL